MDRRRRGRRPVLRALVLLGAVLGLLVTTAGSASALPGIPDCKSPPAATSAGAGVSGLLDPAPNPPAAAADPFAQGSTTSVYEQYGYAGLRFSTYDLGCLGGVTDPGADIDTLVGNWGLSLSVFVVSLGNGLHAKVIDPTWLKPLDDVTGTVTQRIHDTIWAPWGAAALLGVVALLLLYSARGQLSDTVRGAAWALLVLTVLAGVVNYPQLAGQYYDQAVIGTLSSLDSAGSGTGASAAPGAGGAPATATAHGALLVDKVIYQAWLRGEVGAATGPAATTYGPALFKAQAMSYSEVASTAGDQAKRTALLDSKAQAWTTTAQQIQDADPSIYAQLQGRGGGRAAAGALALFGASTTALFRVVADLFLAAGLVMLRILVMFFPAAAVLGVMVVFSGVVRRLANAAGAAVINVVAFGAASVLHTTIVTAALSRVDDGLGWMALVLCLLVTVILFVICLPLLSLTSLAGFGGRRGGWARSGLRGAARLAGGAMIRRRITVPVRSADPDDDERSPVSAPGGADRSRVRLDEQATTDEPVADDDPPPRVWVTPHRPDPSRFRPGGAAPAGPALPPRPSSPAITPTPQRRPALVGAVPPAGPPALAGARPYEDSGLRGFDDLAPGYDDGGPSPDLVLEGVVLERVAGDRAEQWHATNLDTTQAAIPRPLVWDPRTGRAGEAG